MTILQDPVLKTILVLGVSALVSATECGSVSAGPVLGGVDVVQTSIDGSPSLGSSSFVDSSLGGYRFWFASASNMAEFQNNTAHYAPAFGGFCAAQVADYPNHGNGLTGVCTGSNECMEVSWYDGKTYWFKKVQAKNGFNRDHENNVEAGNGYFEAMATDVNGYCFNTEQILLVSKSASDNNTAA